MRILAALITIAIATPLAAQLTPEQRRAREDAVYARSYNRIMATRLEERAQNGDPSAYAGPAGCDAGRFSTGRCGYNRPWRSPAAARNHWMWLQSEPTSPRYLRRSGGPGLWADANTASVLTLASPIGAKGRTLLVRTTIEEQGEGMAWSSEVELGGDAEERYLVTLPALEQGEYQIRIDVYDPASPETPYSTSTTPLTIS